MFLLIISLSLTLSQLLLHHIQLLLTHLSNVELPFFSFLTVNADLLVFSFSFQNTDGTLEAASRAWSSRWDWGSSSNRNQRHLRQNTALQQRSVLKLNHETSPSVWHVWQGCRAIITSTWGQYWVQSSFTCQQNLSNDNKGLWRRLFLLKFEFPKEAAQEAVVDFCLILFSFSFLSPFFTSLS